jgi:hypothetical protein
LFLLPSSSVFLPERARKWHCENGQGDRMIFLARKTQLELDGTPGPGVQRN